MKEDKVFQELDYNVVIFERDHYDNCRFENCSFNKVDISKAIFTDCIFVDCDLSGTLTADTGWRNVHFQNCKLLGVSFEYSNPLMLEMTFEECNLSMSTFYQLPIKGTTFNRCDLSEVDFTESDASEVVFNESNLKGATFDRTKLIQADFRMAYNFRISPENNQIQKARFTSQNLSGLLMDFNIIIE